MLPTADLRCLSHWCRRHGLSWTPARTDDGIPAVLLTPALPGVAPQRLMLVDDADGWRLLDARGEEMATASRLCLLLDALDAGVELRGMEATVMMEPLPLREPSARALRVGVGLLG